MNDAEMFDRLIGDFLPPRVFDAHAHLYRFDMDGCEVEAGDRCMIQRFDKQRRVKLDLLDWAEIAIVE